MLKNHTVETLHQLRLNTMAEAYTRQQQDVNMNDLSFDERFGLLVEHEWTARQNRLLTRLLKKAHLKISAAPEEIDYQIPRGLDRSLVLSTSNENSSKTSIENSPVSSISGIV